MKRIAFALLLCAALLPAGAQNFYENKDIDYGYDNLVAEAGKGNLVAIKFLGDCYNYGASTYKGSVDYNKAY